MRASALPLLLLLQPTPTFRTGTTVVRVDAQVMDGSRIVTDLRQDDFVVLEDGKPQPIRHFEFGDDPLDLLLLVDKSGSMLPATADIALSAAEALAMLRPGDRVGALLFDSKCDLLVAPTASMEEVAQNLQGAIREENIGGGTDINGAVFEAARYMRQQAKTGARRSVLILTDNRSFKLKKDHTVIRELWEADAVLNALIFQSGLESFSWKYEKATHPWMLLATADVHHIVEQTGGESLKAGAPAASFRQMLERIRKRYTLHYRAPAGPAGKQRSVRVALTPAALNRYPGAKVRARRGYIPQEAVP